MSADQDGEEGFLENEVLIVLQSRENNQENGRQEKVTGFHVDNFIL